MGGERISLLTGECENVDPVRDRRSGGIRGADGIAPVRCRQPQQAGEIADPAQQFARHRHLENPWRRCEFGGALAHMMHLHMIPVAVAAVPLIAEQQIRAFLAQYGREPLGGLIDIRASEPDPSRWVRVEHRAVAAVGVAEALDPMRSKNACAGT